ncbi:DNA primase, large subunit [Vulcanisaeta distributa DSM 14429]|uniref:DNA primase large subunit PriL n=1 Tax=Vulcanisaeta distributa (strain DSM 14429 / JCM 11212 / NBRC 100878 / IC-017) TaxID=572478 RepID=E1QRW3_VULDI|nr:DNA primase, large subunit [Vulcanisaeta distributa DSM 14429]
MTLVLRCFNDFVSFIVKYPFSKEGLTRFREITSERGIYINDLANSVVGRQLLQRAYEILSEAILKNSITDDPDLGEDELLAHYIAIVLAAHLDKSLWRRFADVESKRFSGKLALEDPDCVIYIAKEFGINVMRLRDLDIYDESLALAFDVGVRVWDYLRFMPKNDPYWKLVNRYLLKGWVLMTYKDLVRLVEEAVEKKVLELISKAHENLDETKPLIDALGGMKELMEYRSGFTTKVKVQITGLTPPCMEAIINEIKSGGNPSHQARFAVAAYMLRRCHDLEGKPIEDCVEDVVNLFKTVADFDEKKTRYQVEHIAGLRGGRKFYMPPSCHEMNSLGLCPTNLGCGVKSPLQYTAKAIKKYQSMQQAQG